MKFGHQTITTSFFILIDNILQGKFVSDHLPSLPPTKRDSANIFNNFHYLTLEAHIEG